MGDGFSQDAEVGLSGVNFSEDANMPFIFKAHDGSAHIPYDHLLKGKDVFDVVERSFASKDAFEGVEGVVVQHPDDGVDAGGVGQDTQFLEAPEESPVELLLVHKGSLNDAESGTVIQRQCSLIGFRSIILRCC